MNIPNDELTEIQQLCNEVSVLNEGGYTLVHLPGLRILHNGGLIIRDALLCPQPRDGYSTRLFLSESVPGKGNNWTTHVILDGKWHTWSWQNVQPGRLAAVLAQHLVALR